MESRELLKLHIKKTEIYKNVLVTFKVSTIITLSTQPPLVVENGMIYGGSGKVFTLVIRL